MNKLVKGSIAGAAGIALLLGGAGTFALWNDSVVVQSATVQTGKLEIAKTGTPTWSDVSASGSTGATFDPATQKIVPGDTVRLSQTVTISGEGKNLKARFALSDLAAAIPTALSNQITVAGETFTPVTVKLTPTLSGQGAAITAVPNQTNVFEVAPTSGTSSYTVTVDVAFDSRTNAKVGQTQTVDLSKVNFTLTQTR